jgi:hypothetical protein
MLLCINHLEQILQIEGQLILLVRTVKKSESFRTAKYQEFRSLSTQIQLFLIDKIVILSILARMSLVLLSSPFYWRHKSIEQYLVALL